MRNHLRIGMALGVLAAGIAVAPSTATAATACQSDCIASLNVTAGPEAAKFVVTATASVRAALWVAPQNSATPTVTMADQTFTTSHTFATPAKLKADTVYFYRVLATDVLGATRSEYGYFRTAQRLVDVEWSTVDVTDDGDYVGAGELTGGLEVYGDGTTDICPPGKPMSPYSYSSWKTYSDSWPVQTIGSDADMFGCKNAPRVIRPQAMMIEQDSTTGDCVWSADQLANIFRSGGGSGSNSCYDWNSGSTTAADNVDPYGLGYGSGVPFTITSLPCYGGVCQASPEFVVKGSASFTHRNTSPLPWSQGSSPMSLHPSGGINRINEIMLSWVAPGATELVTTKVASYRVEYRRDGAGPWTVLSRPASSTWVIVPADPGTYQVRVTAIGADGLPYGMSYTSAVSGVSSEPQPKATLTSTGGVLKLDINPDVAGAAGSAVQLQSYVGTTWSTVKSVTTSATGTYDFHYLPSGTYRVYAPPQAGKQSATSNTVNHVALKLTAMVFKGTSLYINVNPDRPGTGYWRGVVQRKSAAGWQPITYFWTQGASETYTLPNVSGTYRVVLANQDEYLGFVSPAV